MLRYLMNFAVNVGKAIKIFFLFFTFQNFRDFSLSKFVYCFTEVIGYYQTLLLQLVMIQ